MAGVRGLEERVERRFDMDELLNQIMQAGDGRGMITVRADDLRKFAEYVA